VVAPAELMRPRRGMSTLFAATLASALIGSLWAATALGDRDSGGMSVRARAAKGGKPMPALFQNKVDPPPTPLEIFFGENPFTTSEPLLGDQEGDAEYWNTFLEAAAGIAPGPLTLVRPQAGEPFVPLDGWLSGVTIKGHAVSGDMPGPGGSQPFRVGVEQVLASGQLQVVSTSDPPFRLSGTDGTYYFDVGPPHTNFQMRVKKGEIVSFDTRGGTWAVFAKAPGSSTADTVGKGLEQNAGVIWTGVPHVGVALQMQVAEVPSLPVTDLEKAASAVGEAEKIEQQAESGGGKGAHALSRATGLLHSARVAVEEAGVGAEPGLPENLPEISANTEASLKHYLGLALVEDLKAKSKKLSQGQRSAHIKAALSAKRTALSDIRKAKSLAKQVP
jgi:hypothetical protein